MYLKKIDNSALIVNFVIILVKMKKVELEIKGISYSHTKSGAYALILGEIKGMRRLPIVIGTFEAQSIVYQMEGIKSQRPLTHDLFLSMATAFHIKIIEVNIVKVEEGIFYGELVCLRKNAKIKIDSRTSDAIALALRFNCPIYANETVMKKASVILDTETGKILYNEDIEQEAEEETDYGNLSVDELEEKLNEAISNEDYEKASVIRDEINKKKNKEDKK